jgi:hypothetical protein
MERYKREVKNNMNDNNQKMIDAVAYFEDAVKESDEIINDCSTDLQKELTEQKGHFIVALAALREKAEKPAVAEEIKRNCNTCKFSIFKTCDTLKNNVEYQEIKDEGLFDSMIEKHKFKENFICNSYKCRYIEYPIEVSKINRSTESYCLEKSYIGRFVSIRPCGEVYKDKTYLGLYLGDLPIGHHITHHPETKELKVSFDCNPAIFVFDLKKIVYGCESWWGIIENEDDLKKITDQDIDNVWYVKALKEMCKEEGKGEDDGDMRKTNKLEK